MNDQEMEVKFYIGRLSALETHIRSMGASLVRPRTHEVNLRFDTPEGDLRKLGKVLRLRQDINAVLTYKGPGQVLQDVSARQEIEFSVSDFDTARRFLEALGYTVSIIYEKHRAIYRLDDVLIMLDEMPYGTFIETEGQSPEQIREVVKRLGLKWNARNTESYLAIFSRLQERRQLSFRDLTFDNFHNLKIEPADLGIEPADD